MPFSFRAGSIAMNAVGAGLTTIVILLTQTDPFRTFLAKANFVRSPILLIYMNNKDIFVTGIKFAYIKL
jgi:hypothetical protein